MLDLEFDMSHELSEAEQRCLQLTDWFRSKGMNKIADWFSVEDKWWFKLIGIV